MEAMTTIGEMELIMVPPWVLALLTVVSAVGASGGFWAYLQSRDQTRSATTQLLLGMAHDRIIYLGKQHIQKGSITPDEYEDFMKYLWEPYSHFGGNGLAERIVQEVKRLSITGTATSIVPKIKEYHVYPNEYPKYGLDE